MTRRLWLPLLFALLPGACGEPLPSTCNGEPRLCDRRFDEVTYPGTHNAHATLEANWGAPNQGHGLPKQLDDGIRLLLLDLYDFEGQVQLCHGPCQLGSRPLREALDEIKRFLDRRRGEVLVVVLECYVAAAAVKAQLDGAGLAPYLHAQERGAPWPTLGEMVRRNRRLVIFTDRQGGAYPWYHDQWQHTWETPYSFRRPEDFTCARDRGDAANPLYSVNHFLTAPLASPELARQVNFNPLLGERLERCRRESGRRPNFVAVDYYEIGDLFAAVATLNGVGGAGR